MKKLIALFLLSWMCLAKARVELCHFSFLVRSQEDPSTFFISYLDFLNERKVLDVDEFEEVLVRLESGALINPFEAKEVSKENKAYGEVFQDYINVGIDKEKIKNYLESIVKKEKQTAREINKTKEEVKNVFSSVQTGEITPGSSKGKFEIDYSFEVMTTPVTVAQWDKVLLFEFAPSSIGSLEMPKTNINFFSQAFFADRLSEMNNYRPVYRFDDINSDNLSAYGGRLKGYGGWELKTIRDLTNEEGYRLPTLNEQKLLMQKAIDYLGDDFDELIDDYAYLSHNSNLLIQNTTDKKPFQIEGQSFYDVIGNVAESALKLQRRLRADNFYTFHEGSGSSLSSKKTFEKTYPQNTLNGSEGNFRGLRLVRTLKK